MQEYLARRARIDEFFSNNTSSVIKSYMTPMYWVVTFHDSIVDDTDLCLGVFSTEANAVQSALDYLIRTGNLVFMVLDDFDKSIQNFQIQIKTHRNMWNIVFSLQELDIGYK